MGHPAAPVTRSDQAAAIVRSPGAASRHARNAMTSGNDKKGPPGPPARRPAPPPRSGPTSGGAAARPPSTVPNATRPQPAGRPAAPPARPAPPPRAAQHEDLDADAKTTAFNLADMGLD